MLAPLLFLIYDNDWPDNLNSLIKLFADDTALFFTVYDPNHSAKVLNDDLNKSQNGLIYGKCYLILT